LKDTPASTKIFGCLVSNSLQLLRHLKKCSKWNY